MVSEWLAPLGTIATAGLGGWLGGRRSRKGQEAQHRFEREKALTDHGRDRVDDAITALRFLQAHAHAVINPSGKASAVDLEEVARQAELLVRAIPYLTDPQTRSAVELIHSTLSHAWALEQYSSADLGDQQVIVRRSCGAGVEVLGRYLRYEPWVDDDYLARLRDADDEALAELAEQDAWHRADLEADAKAKADERRRKREQPPTD